MIISISTLIFYCTGLICSLIWAQMVTTIKGDSLFTEATSINKSIYNANTNKNDKLKAKIWMLLVMLLWPLTIGYDIMSILRALLTD